MKGKGEGNGIGGANQRKWMQNGRWGSMEGKRPMHWQRRKSRVVLSQGREGEKTRYLGLARGRKEQSSGR